jgi:ribonuclease T2
MLGLAILSGEGRPGADGDAGMKWTVGIALVLLSLSGSAHAFEKLDGWFIAFEACEAYQSKNRLTNPGDIRTAPLRAYPIRGINKPGGDFYRIRVPDAPVTPDRWVNAGCGLHVVDAGTAGPAEPPEPVVVTPPPGDESDENLLALSWQPAFCEARPAKRECVQLNGGLLPVTETQLSVHGLWPQPRGNVYCGVPPALVDLDKDGRWSELPEPALDIDTREALDVAMPGTASFLQRHEWIKHGTCYRAAGGADEYFDDTLLVTEAINGSAVGAFLADHVGAEVATRDVRARFDEAFGQGAGDRVQFHCAGDGSRVLLQEIKIHLRGTIRPETPVSELLLAADAVPIGCPGGIIDPAGLQ